MKSKCTKLCNINSLIDVGSDLFQYWLSSIVRCLYGVLNVEKVEAHVNGDGG